jgi:hypothetical protein
MTTYVETKRGEIVTIGNGVLVCENVKENWDTITEWLLAQDKDFKATVVLSFGDIHVAFDDSVPTHMMDSLLEAFNYQ